MSVCRTPSKNFRQGSLAARKPQGNQPFTFKIGLKCKTLGKIINKITCYIILVNFHLQMHKLEVLYKEEIILLCRRRSASRTFHCNRAVMLLIKKIQELIVHDIMTISYILGRGGPRDLVRFIKKNTESTWGIKQ